MHKSEISNVGVNSEYISLLQSANLKLCYTAAGQTCPIKRLNNSVGFLLKPLLSKVKLVCQTNCFWCNKIILCSLGLEATEFWLDKYSKLVHSRFTKTCLKVLNTVLKNTNFILNDQPLGSSIGPIIALCDTDHGIRRNSVVQ